MSRRSAPFLKRQRRASGAASSIARMANRMRWNLSKTIHPDPFAPDSLWRTSPELSNAKSSYPPSAERSLLRGERNKMARARPRAGRTPFMSASTLNRRERSAMRPRTSQLNYPQKYRGCLRNELKSEKERKSYTFHLTAF
jgi:hypothetical protein